MYKIPFTKPTATSVELALVREALLSNSLAGNGHFSDKCLVELKKVIGSDKVLLTDSCTGALELIALQLDIKEGDEIIVPSYTFVSSAVPFANLGAKIIFADINEHDWNLSWADVESKISTRTKAIVVVHIGGVDAIGRKSLNLLKKNNIKIIEDAAQAIGAMNKDGCHLGTIGDYGVISFHDTKNITSAGEGGCIIVKCSGDFEKIKISQEKGTNRSAFKNGLVDKYTWVAQGRSALMAEPQCAFLTAQLSRLDEINSRRKILWQRYHETLASETQFLKIPELGDKGNGHVFNVEIDDRSSIIHHMMSLGITTPFHYVPLESSIFALKNFNPSPCPVSQFKASRNIRLPLYFDLTFAEQDVVMEQLIIGLSK